MVWFDLMKIYGAVVPDSRSRLTLLRVQAIYAWEERTVGDKGIRQIKKETLKGTKKEKKEEKKKL